jgi:hypothetical protein
MLIQRLSQLRIGLAVPMPGDRGRKKRKVFYYDENLQFSSKKQFTLDGLGKDDLKTLTLPCQGGFSESKFECR